MHARTISLVIVALLLGAGVRASAEDGGAAEPDAGGRTPPTSKLPVEDPTIHQERHEELQGQAAEGSGGSGGAEDESAAGESENQALILTEGSEDEAQQTTSSLPVEDPTLKVEDEVVLTPSPEPEPKGEPTETPEDDWGQKVKVAYGYQGGLLVAVDDWFYLALSGLVQARYAVNYRTKPPTDSETGEREKQVTQGFDVARARFHLGIGLTEFVALYMRIGVVSGGDFSFQRAFIDLKWKYFRLRAGLFMNELIAESLINPNDHLFNDYSIVENVYGPGSSKGVMLTYLRKRFSINLGYSDGLRTGFSEIRSPARADFAVTLRAQYAWGERGLGGFNRLIARRGTPMGVRLGAALHYQDGGRSQGTSDVQIALGTIDLSVRGNGWSLLFSATTGQDGRINVADPTQTFEVVTAGFSVVGGYFLLDDLQIFGQYGVVTKPRIQGEPPPSAPNVPTDEPSNFHSFGVGLTYFVIPGRDNVKLSTDFQYFLGSEAGNPVPASSLNNIQPNDAGSQFFWRLQISAAF
jgi:hypothetical protein